jgi:hypothetical protein
MLAKVLPSWPARARYPQDGLSGAVRTELLRLGSCCVPICDLSTEPIALFLILTKMSSFLVYWFPALPPHFPDGSCPVRGPQPWPLLGWGFQSAANLIVRGAMGIKAVATPEARATALRVCAARADARAAALAPVIAEIQASGIPEPYAIAAALTARGVPTARGVCAASACRRDKSVWHHGEEPTSGTA